MKIVYLPKAKSDLIWFRQYYESIFPEGAAKAKNQYMKTIKLIETHPYLGHESDIDNLREYSLPRTPFSIIYRITGNEIHILRLWDGRADQTHKWS
jgi:plasmid stabilization system protein ParE